MSTPTTTTYTPKTWADRLLGLLGDPVTPGAETAVVAWEAQEGGNWHNNAFGNPLNTTQPEPGSTPINSVGVQSFATWDQGLAATVATLFSGGTRYLAIRQGLAAGDAQATAQAIVNSPWGTKTIDLGNGSTYNPGSTQATPAGGGTAGASSASFLGIPSPSDAVKTAGHYAILAVLLAAGAGLVVIGVVKASGAADKVAGGAKQAAALAPMMA